MTDPHSPPAPQPTAQPEGRTRQAHDPVAMPEAHDLVVSIINYRTAEMTLACVASVLADLAGPEGGTDGGTDGGPIDGHVVVVDNASGDGSAEAIADWIAAQPAGTPVTLVRSATNSGFSGGHNRGIGARRARFYLVLNSDAVLRPGFCAAILAAAAADPGAGLLAPRLEDEDGTLQTSCFRVPSPASELIRGANSGPVTRALRRWDVPMAMPPRGPIGWASFACILLRADMVAAIGPMDEGYFLYFEDTEYCLRARRAGWRIAWAPAARAVHYRGGSAPVKSLARAKKRLPGYFYASRARLMAQAHGRAGLWAANGLWHLGRGFAQLRALAGRDRPRAVEAEARDIWTNAARPVRPPAKPVAPAEPVTTARPSGRGR